MATKKQPKKKTVKRVLVHRPRKAGVNTARRAELVESLQAFDWGVIRKSLRMYIDRVQDRGFYGYPSHRDAYQQDLMELGRLYEKIAAIENTYEPAIKHEPFKL